MTFSNVMRGVSIDQFQEIRTSAMMRKPQASLERAMGHISRRERDIGPALGDALQIIQKAHGQIMRERSYRVKEEVA